MNDKINKVTIDSRLRKCKMIKKIRNENNDTQEKFADIVRTSVTTLKRIEGDNEKERDKVSDETIDTIYQRSLSYGNKKDRLKTKEELENEKINLEIEMLKLEKNKKIDNVFYLEEEIYNKAICDELGYHPNLYGDIELLNSEEYFDVLVLGSISDGYIVYENEYGSRELLTIAKVNYKYLVIKITEIGEGEINVFESLNGAIGEILKVSSKIDLKEEDNACIDEIETNKKLDNINSFIKIVINEFTK